jgi:hypothetical protein
MKSISRFHLGHHENGTWHVIDAKTGGPVEVTVDGKFYLLQKLPKEEADAWSMKLNNLRSPESET